jgi:hypothetical protein
LPPRPNQPKKTRRDLAEQVSFVSPLKMRRGMEAMRWFLDKEKKGATAQDLFDETHQRFADKDTETGLARDAAGHIASEVTDEGFKVKDAIGNYAHPTAGGVTPWLNAEDTLEWPEMFRREPRLRKVKTQFVMPPAGANVDPGGWYDRRKAPLNPTGMSRMVAEPGSLDPNDPTDPMSLRNAAAHELGGHANQDFGGFLTGGQTGADVNAAHDKLVFPRARMFRDVIEGFKGGMGLPDDEWKKQFKDADYHLRAANALMGTPGRNPNMSTVDELTRYSNISGEVSANQVMDRLNLTAPERQDDPFWKAQTGYAPYDLQLLRKGTKTYGVTPDATAKKRLAEILGKTGVAATAGAGAVAAGSDAEAAPMFQTDYNPFAADPTRAPEDQPAPGKTFADRVEEARAPKPEPEPQGWMDWIGDTAVSGANTAVDVAKTIPGAVRNAFESAGALGDYAPAKEDLLNWINKAGGHQFYPQKNIDAAVGTFTKGLPTTEGIHDTVSSVLPKEVEDFTTHDPETTAGALMGANIEMGLDPAELLSGLGAVSGVSKAKKILALLKAGKLR